MSVRDSDMVNYTCQEDYEIKFQLQELSLLLYDICVWDHPLMTLRNFFSFSYPLPLSLSQSRNLSVLSSRFWQPPPPPQRDIIYGWSL